MSSKKRTLKNVFTVDLIDPTKTSHFQADFLTATLFELKYRKRAAIKCKTWTRFQIEDWKAAGNTEEWDELIKQLPKSKYLYDNSLVFDIYGSIGMYSRELLGTVSRLRKLHITGSNKIIKTSLVLDETVKLHLTSKRMVWSWLIAKLQSAIQQHSLSLQADVDNAIVRIEHQLQHLKSTSI